MKLVWYPFLFLAIASFSPAHGEASPPPTISEAEIEAARMRMLNAISRANFDGLVRVKTEGAPDAIPALSEATIDIKLSEAIESDSIETANAPLARPDCVDAARFLADEKLDAPIDQTGLEALREIITTPGLPGKQEAARDLAWVYLRLGFFAEARAIAKARSPDDNELEFLQSLAEVALGTPADVAKALAPFTNCHESIKLLQLAALIDEGRGRVDLLSDVSAGALSQLTPMLAATTAERIALFALDQGDEETALGYYAVALAARDNEMTPSLVILNDRFGNRANLLDIRKSDLIDLATEDSPMSERAIAAIARKADPNDAPYDGYLDDLSELNPISDPSAALSGATALLSADRVSDAVDLLVKGAAQNDRNDPKLQRAREIVREALGESDLQTKIVALDTFINHLPLLAEPASSKEASLLLANWGSVDLVERVIEATPTLSPVTKADLRKLARQNSSAPPPRSRTPFGSSTPYGENALKTIDGCSDLNTDETAGADLESCEHLAKGTELELQNAQTAILAALAKGARPPEKALEALSPDDQEALRHFSDRLKPINRDSADEALGFARGIETEIAFFERELSNE